MYLRESNLLSILLLFFPVAFLQAFTLSPEKESVPLSNSNRANFNMNYLEELSDLEKNKHKSNSDTVEQAKEIVYDDSKNNQLLKENDDDEKVEVVAKKPSTVTYYWAHQPELSHEVKLTEEIDEVDLKFFKLKKKHELNHAHSRERRWGSEEAQKKWIKGDLELTIAKKIEKNSKREIISEKFGKEAITYNIWLNLEESKDRIRSLRVGYLARKNEDGEVEKRFPLQYKRLLNLNCLKRNNLVCPIRVCLILTSLGILGTEIFLIIKAIPKYNHVGNHADMAIAGGEVGAFGIPLAGLLLLLAWDPSCFKTWSWFFPNTPHKIILKQKPSYCLELFCCSKKVEEASQKIKIRPRYDLCFGLFRWPYCWDESCSSNFFNTCIKNICCIFRKCCSSRKMPLIDLKVGKVKHEKYTITLKVPIGEQS